MIQYFTIHLFSSFVVQPNISKKRNESKNCVHFVVVAAVLSDCDSEFFLYYMDRFFYQLT